MSKSKPQIAPVRRLSSSNKMDLAVGMGTALSIPLAYVAAKRANAFRIGRKMRWSNQLKTAINRSKKVSWADTDVNALLRKGGYLSRKDLRAIKEGRDTTNYGNKFRLYLQNYPKMQPRLPVMVPAMEDGSRILRKPNTTDEALTAYLMQNQGSLSKELRYVVDEVRKKRILISQGKAEGYNAGRKTVHGEEFRPLSDRDLYDQIRGEAVAKGKLVSLPQNPEELVHMRAVSVGRGRTLKLTKKGKFAPPREYLSHWKRKE